MKEVPFIYQLHCIGITNQMKVSIKSGPYLHPAAGNLARSGRGISFEERRVDGGDDKDEAKDIIGGQLRQLL